MGAIMPQHLTRRTVYDLVWVQPMTHVAAGLGVSNVAFKKICVKHRIPTPTRGYWAMKLAGKTVRQVHFRAASDPKRELVVIHGAPVPREPEVRQAIERARQRRRRAPPPPVVTVAEPVAAAAPDSSPLAATCNDDLRESGTGV